MGRRYKAQHTLASSTAHLKHISEAGNLNYGMSEYAAYFSYTIIQISRYSNMLQMCRALCKCVLRFMKESQINYYLTHFYLSLLSRKKKFQAD